MFAIRLDEKPQKYRKRQTNQKLNSSHKSDALLNGVGGARLVLELDKRKALDATLLAVLGRRVPRQRQRLDRAAHTGRASAGNLRKNADAERKLEIRK